MNRIRDAFDAIRADDSLLEKTAQALRQPPARKMVRSRPGRVRGAVAAMGAAAAVLLLAVGALRYGLQTAAAYVSVDVNPSLELTVNRLNRVIGARAFNPEGEQLLEQSGVKGKHYESALTDLLAVMEREGYLSGDALVSVTVQAQDEGKQRQLYEAVARTVTSRVSAAQTAAQVEVFPVTAQVRTQALDCHMTPAKYLAIQALLEVDDTATLEQYSDAGIGQIRQRTQECREAHGITGAQDEGHGITDAQDAGHGGGHGETQGSGHGRTGHH